MKYQMLLGLAIPLFAVVLITNFQICECKAFGPLTSRSSTDDFLNQAYDVATGKRELKIRGNILNGDAEVTTSYSNEEIMEIVAIGGGILLALVCCGVCFKHCCCPNKPPTVIMYQQMPSAQPQNATIIRAALSGNGMIPMRNQGLSVASSQFIDTSPPPPYPGIHA